MSLLCVFCFSLGSVLVSFGSLWGSFEISENSRNLGGKMWLSNWVTRLPLMMHSHLIKDWSWRGLRTWQWRGIKNWPWNGIRNWPFHGFDMAWFADRNLTWCGFVLRSINSGHFLNHCFILMKEGLQVPISSLAVTVNQLVSGNVQ